MNLNTAPTYFHFPPTGKPKAEDKYDIARYEISQQTETLAFSANQLFVLHFQARLHCRAVREVDC